MIELLMFCRAGDQLVSVNGMKVFGMSVEQVKGLLATISSAEIEFEVLDSRYFVAQCSHAFQMIHGI